MGAGKSAYAAPVACRPRQKYQCAGKVRTTARTHNPNRPNRTIDPNQPITAVTDSEYCCNGMITLPVEQLDNHQRNAYGTTRWTTDYAGRNPVEGVNGMIKQDGSFEPRSCRAFGLAPHTLAALMAAVVHNLKQTRRAQSLKNNNRSTTTKERTHHSTGAPPARTPQPNTPTPSRAPP